MKTRFSRRHSPLSVRAGLATLAAVLILLVLLALRFLAPSFFDTLATPFWEIGSAATATLEREIDARALSEAGVTLQARVEALEAENRTLRSMLADYDTLPTDTAIVARVLSRPPVTPYDVLVIDRGSEAGVGVNALAYAPGGIPVGIVADVGVHSARIALFSAPGRMTEVWAGESRYPLTLSGEGSGTFSAHVPREAPVAEGDTVYFSGGIPSAYIVKVTESASAPETNLHIRPFVNPFTLTSVAIGEVPL